MRHRAFAAATLLSVLVLFTTGCASSSSSANPDDTALKDTALNDTAPNDTALKDTALNDVGDLPVMTGRERLQQAMQKTRDVHMLEITHSHRYWATGTTSTFTSSRTQQFAEWRHVDDQLEIPVFTHSERHLGDTMWLTRRTRISDRRPTTWFEFPNEETIDLADVVLDRWFGDLISAAPEDVRWAGDEFSFELAHRALLEAHWHLGVFVTIRAEGAPGLTSDTTITGSVDERGRLVALDIDLTDLLAEANPYDSLRRVGSGRGGYLMASLAYPEDIVIEPLADVVTDTALPEFQRDVEIFALYELADDVAAAPLSEQLTATREENPVPTALDLPTPAELPVGTCLRFASATWFPEEPVPCAEPHRTEVTGILDLTEFGWNPDLDPWLVEHLCNFELVEHLQVPASGFLADDDGWQVSAWMAQSQAEWDRGARHVICVVSVPHPGISESVAGLFSDAVLVE